jgi:PAS domain S-box-containing protein
MQFELTHLVDALPGPGWTALPDGRAEFLNQRWLAYTGLTAEGAAGLGWMEAVHPDDRDGFIAHWQVCVTTGAPCDTEARLRRRDGAFRWFLFRANPLRDTAGNVSRWFGINVDIEDRRRTEEALRANERNLSLILNTIPTSIHVLGTDGSVLYVNQAVLDYTGLTTEDVRKEDYRARIFHPDDLKRVHEERLAALRRPVPFELEMRTRANDGSYRWFLNRYSPLLDKHGRLDRWYAASFDIENHKRAVDELKLRVDMIHMIPAPVWSVRADGTPDIVNQGWYDYTGQTPDYVRSHPAAWMATMHPDDAEHAGKIYWDGILSGTGFTMEARFLRASDGTYRWHLNRAAAVRDSAGNIIRFVGTSTDVEDLKGAQEELHATRAALAHVTRVMTMGELTASIAHEINQPLSGIITNANVCLRTLASDQPNIERAQDALRRTIRDATRVSDVITRLRALFSKKETATEPVDLTEATREVIALCGSELQRKGAVLRAELASDIPAVIGDRVQLQQVILNLLTNAADSMLDADGPRELLIQTALDEDDRVRVTVRDSGMGFDPRDAEKLFAAFYSTKPQGMGIGLSVSRSIIESHHGRIWAAANEGRGATVSFSIPHGPDTAAASRS